jgi:ATP-dependent Lhr-like helicase
MQGDAVSAILDGDGHVLLAGATASGKTEAAFLPILTDLDASPSSSVGVLYIGPLKALINDQFYRLDLLLEDAGIPVWPWHGDVPQSVKRRALKECRGVIQTTPESLEGFLLYRSQHLQKLFGDLRYVVIDEVHAFMAMDRGRQILCQLGRLERLLGVSPRRIGLSATLGDYELAKAWLAGGSDKPVTVLDDHQSKRAVRIALEHYLVVEEELASPQKSETAEVLVRVDGDQSRPDVDAGDRVDPRDGAEHDYMDPRVGTGTSPHIASMYERTLKGKSLIFVNSRSDAEEIGAGLRELAERNGRDDIYFVHHGSISKEYRLDAEEAMREEGRSACTVATVTLELGIDLGQLERVLQYEAPHSVSSFVQRLGRTGRRGAPGDMTLYTVEPPPASSEPPLKRIPWQLLKTIATIQLYVEEKWVEPIEPPKLPLSLLYHQTMSTLMQHGEMLPADLADRVLTLPPFSEVGKERYRRLLTHLLAIDHLQWTERRRLLIGLAAEPVVNDWRFLATFADSVEYDVIAGSEHVGTLMSPPPVDTVFRLAGRTWRVKDVDMKKRAVLVQRARGKARTTWAGGGGGIHIRVMERIRQLLDEELEPGYLNDIGLARLREARELSMESQLTVESVLPASEGSSFLVPWLGSSGFAALMLALKARLGDTKVSTGDGPFFMTVKVPMGAVVETLEQPLSQDEIRSELSSRAVPRDGKFDEYIPEDLVLEAFVEDAIDVEEAEGLRRIVRGVGETSATVWP